MKNIFLFLISVVCISTAKVHVGPIYTGVGSWISFNSDNSNYTSYNKLSSDIYLGYNGWSGFIGIPLQSVVNHGTEETKQAFSTGDLSFYIGRKISFIQPRVGMVLPLWYSTKKGVWLGSKNIIVKTGLGFSGSLFSSKTWKFGGEVYFKYNVAGFPQIEDSWGKSGSWAVDGSVKVVNKSIKKWDIGIEYLGGYKKFYARWLKNKSFQGYQLSTSCVPHLFANYDITGRMYLSGKAGFGPSFKREVTKNDRGEWEHSSNSLNIGIGFGFYP